MELKNGYEFLWCPMHDTGKRVNIGMFQEVHSTKWNEDEAGYQEMILVTVIPNGTGDEEWENLVYRALFHQYTDKDWNGDIRKAIRRTTQLRATQWAVFLSVLRRI